ncbi:hypothetical protein T08_12442 [Trichinella sp. T8]|nr:hypothetical protein T08_12442 [Trichinella sp. T8]
MRLKFIRKIKLCMLLMKKLLAFFLKFESTHQRIFVKVFWMMVVMTFITRTCLQTSRSVKVRFLIYDEYFQAFYWLAYASNQSGFW